MGTRRLVGYDDERSLLGGLVTSAARGDGGAIAVVGGPGTGKTALCDEAVAGADGVRVVRVVGTPAERSLAFGGLHTLIAPVREHLDALSINQRVALETAIALGSGPPPDRLGLGVATHALLQVVGPTLVVVDDVHWVDLSTLAVVGFVARRTAGTSIGVVLALRPHADIDRDLAGVRRLHLGGLDLEEVRQVAVEASKVDVAGRVASRLHRLSGGAPLVVDELARALPVEVLQGRMPFPDLSLLQGSTVDLYTAQILALPEVSRSALLVAASSDEVATATVMAVLAQLQIPVQALLTAVDRGLVTVGDAVRFVHPLARTAAYHLASADQRRTVHQTLGAAAQTAERRVWHLAQAATGPDEELAGDLLRVAGEVAARGGYAEAGTLSEKTARVTATPATAATARLGAARWWFMGGYPERALTPLDELLAGDPAGLALQAELLRAEVDLWSGRPPLALERLTAAASNSDPTDAAPLQMAASIPAVMTGQIALGVELAEQAHATLRRAGHPAWPLAAAALAEAVILVGQRDRGMALLDEARDRVELGSMEPETLTNAFVHSHAWTMAECYEQAEAILNPLITTAEDIGALSLLPFSLTALAEIRLRQGRLGLARQLATRARDLATEIGHMTELGHIEAILARIAATADDPACRDHAAATFACVETTGAEALSGYAHHALGAFDLGRSAVEDALGHLTAAAHSVNSHGVVDPGVVPLGPDLVEAHVRAGGHDEAAAALAWLEETVAVTGSPWGHACVLRLRGLLEVAPEPLEESTRQLAALGLKVDEARSRLCLGEVLRRRGQRLAARKHLRQAANALSHAGAQAWARRATEELRLAGTKPRRQTAEGCRQLTAREHQIASLVATGASNRQVAAELYLSPKTIENYLTQIYGKLGVSSRTELAAQLLQERIKASPDRHTATD